MKLLITAATHTDAEIIADYNCRMALETENKTLDLDIVRQGVDALFKDSSKGFYTVARANDLVIGQLMITYEWSDWRNASFWWIQSVYVAPEYRRQGVFKSLYKHIEHQARLHNSCGLRLYAENNNMAAHSTYTSLGMEHTHYTMFEKMFN